MIILWEVSVCQFISCGIFVSYDTFVSYDILATKDSDQWSVVSGQWSVNVAEDYPGHNRRDDAGGVPYKPVKTR